MKQIRHALGDAIGRRLSLADLAKLCGLKDPDGSGKKRYRQWEEDAEPIPGPAAMLLSLYNAGIDYGRIERTIDFIIDHIRERLDGEA